VLQQQQRPLHLLTQMLQTQHLVPMLMVLPLIVPAIRTMTGLPVETNGLVARLIGVAEMIGNQADGTY
jgi:predicted MFS family arabinose efflux permease